MGGFMSLFGTQLKAARTARKIALRPFADAVGCHPTTVHYVEIGRARPSEELARRLATELDKTDADEWVRIAGYLSAPLLRFLIADPDRVRAVRMAARRKLTGKKLLALVSAKKPA